MGVEGDDAQGCGVEHLEVKAGTRYGLPACGVSEGVSTGVAIGAAFPFALASIIFALLKAAALAKSAIVSPAEPMVIDGPPFELDDAIVDGPGPPSGEKTVGA